jgi:V/A-type H+-transporting ATPase subunit A
VRRLDPLTPLFTGQRAIDTLFPIARGGSATIPGGFGTGKTVTEHSLARWADADVVVFVACGERGNELSDVLTHFPRLVDPRTGASLMDRTILVANTSNMPVAAREASIYTGLTIAEYFRDQRYDVALMADSTSRWGEALREVSGRLEEMPGEEGYPAYLPSRLAEFYERAGLVVPLGSDGATGSVTIVAAVSPPGGDLSEPVTQYSLRLAGTFWSLDADLARRRHFPAIHYTKSYTLYELDAWFAEHVRGEWPEQRRWALALLQEEERLQGTVQLLGADVLAPAERLVLDSGRMLREDFLQQSAFDAVDACCSLEKQHWMLWTLMRVHEHGAEAVRRGIDVAALGSLAAAAEIARMRDWLEAEAETRARALVARHAEEAAAL